MNVLTKPTAAPTGASTISTPTSQAPTNVAPMPSNAVAPVSTPTTLAPSTFAEVLEFAAIAARSAFVPKDYRNHPEDILLAVQLGHEVGLRPMQALQNIAVINGRPAVWGDALPGLCKASPVYEDLLETFEREDDPDFLVAVCVAKRHGSTPVTARFSVQDAKRAGLWTKPIWQNYPRRMLQMRARSFALRDAFPDVLKGLIAIEEARDLPPPAYHPSDAPTIDAAPEPPAEAAPPLAEAPSPDTSAEAGPDASPANPPADPPSDGTTEPSGLSSEPNRIYPLETKQGVTTFRTSEEWLDCWARIVRACKSANALDKLQTARDTNAAHIASVAAFDPAPVATLNAELARALAPASPPAS